MADDIGFQPIAQQPADDVGFKPVPKIPDTSGVQKMARDNLAANDNKEVSAEPQPPQTPMERTSTAAGFPVDKVINGTASPSDFNTQHRAEYVKALDSGSASNSGDWMQTMLHAIAPIVASGVQRAMHPLDFAKEAAGDVISGFKGGAENIAYPFLSEENKAEILKNRQFSDYKDPENPTGPELERRAIELEQSTIGKGMGGLYAPMGLIAPIINPIIQSTGGKPLKSGEAPTYQSNTPGLFGAGMDVLGGLGVVHGASELRAARTAGTQFAPGAGPWDNHPGSEAIVDAVAKKMGKQPAEVNSQDIDQTIAQGSKDIHPAGKDFKDVSTVTGIPESSLKIVFKETGVKPDQVFADVQRDPTVATDVAAGKVPEQYEHLVEEKPVLPTKEAEKLTVAKDETTRSFTVVDKDGDHVSGGFDSHEEAQHYIEDEKFKAEERKAIEEEKAVTPASVKSPATELDVAGKQGEQLAAANEGRLKPTSAQKAPSEGLFDVAGRGQKDLLDLTNERVPVPVRANGEVASIPGGNESHPAENASGGIADKNRSEALSKPQSSKKTIPAAESGKPTSLNTFLRNNGGIKDEGGNLAAMGEKSLIRKNGMDWDDATQLAHEYGYFSERPSIPELQNKLLDTNGGRDYYRDQDAERVVRAKENSTLRQENDPAYVEDYAHKLGLDIEKRDGETENQFVKRLKDAIKDFYKSTEGSAEVGAYRKAIGDVINAAEKFVGKLTGGLFKKLADGYIKTFQPELTGPIAKRADAYLAKYKAEGQEAENAYYRQSAASKIAFDKLTHDERMQWLYDHETGRWDADLDPDHARFQAMFDAMHEAEQKAIGTETGYKENYLPHQWEKPDEVKAFFGSDAMIKKHGADWFKNASEFKLIQEGVRAGFKLKTDNPESMLVARQLASANMIRTMDLLRDMESSGIAKRATAFGIDKKIAKTETAIAEIQEKYKKEFEKKNNPNQATMEGVPPAESKAMQLAERQLDKLQKRLDDFKKEKSENKSTPAEMQELKGGFRVIGPDSKVWNIHQQVGPLWKNAMEMKGLWENEGVTGDAYRTYMQGKAIWTQVKLGLSLFHPIHVAMIDLASDIASAADHLIQGGKFSDLATRESLPNVGITKETFKGKDHPAVQAWNTPDEARTPEQKQMVSRMVEGGFKPTMSARDTVHFKENFDKAIAGVGLNNLRLLGTIASLPGVIMKPFFEHWIPGMKSEIYLNRYQDALNRDPSLANDSGRRSEMARQIAKDTDRTYGEMNQDVQFWNKNVKDSFNAAFISGGWKLAQIYNARGLLQPLNIAYKFAKTGEFSKADVTYNMLQAYAYTGLTLALGGAINAMLGNPIGTAKDTVWDMVKNLVAPQTGEKNPDGTPIRLNQPAFAKEAYNVAHEINTKGLVAGTGSFLYHQTLIPGIVNTLTNRDFYGREEISDPTDLQQWRNAGWDSIMPISFSNEAKAEQKHSEVGKVAGALGFPMAGAYLNQTPFEQKVIAKYDEQNPPKGDAYSAKLKTQLKSAIANGKGIDEVKQKMKEEGMTSEEISHAEKVYTKPFAEEAWKKLPAEDQKRLIESATDEEKKKFKVKSN